MAVSGPIRENRCCLGGSPPSPPPPPPPPPSQYRALCKLPIVHSPTSLCEHFPQIFCIPSDQRTGVPWRQGCRIPAGIPASVTPSRALCPPSLGHPDPRHLGPGVVMDPTGSHTFTRLKAKSYGLSLGHPVPTFGAHLTAHK